MTSRGVEAYQLGRDYTVMPIPMDPAHCHEIVAGPLSLVAESRWLSAARVREHAARTDQLDEIDDVSNLEDSGLSIHVLDVVDRVEHLRFDCFERDPHYHYIRHADGNNTVVRLDDVAEGDPLGWVIERLRTRLPNMLEHVGLTDLAARVRAERVAVARSIDELERLLSDLARRGAHQ